MAAEPAACGQAGKQGHSLPACAPQVLPQQHLPHDVTGDAPRPVTDVNQAARHCGHMVDHTLRQLHHQRHNLGASSSRVDMAETPR